MLNLPLQPRYILPSLSLFIVIGVIFLFHETLRPMIGYTRELIDQGEYWRMLVGNFVHTNQNHFLLNASAILLVWALHAEHYTFIRYWALALFCALFCGLGLWLFEPQMTGYVGLSGALHGIIFYGAVKDITVGYRTGWLLAIGVFVKVGLENTYGASGQLEHLIDARVAVEAHLYGTIGGFIASIMLWPQVLKTKAKTEETS
ncbi:rhombosortase [Algicola sagamiensis]|uniref:rhombosortase n=1 Tax=Algicola sagamiensis TaxID=163869 RepID=UPI00036A5C5C|nr:rhombosortase [Algicola sagamiensis]